MTSPGQLARLVAAGPGTLVQPARPRQAPITVSPPLGLSAALGLGTGRWIAVIADAAGARWTAPLVEEDGRVRRAMPGDGVAEALIARLCQDQPATTSGFGFGFQYWAGTPVTGEGPLAAAVDQTNETVIVGAVPGSQYPAPEHPSAPPRADRPRGGLVPGGPAAVVKWLVHQPPAGAAAEHPAVRRLSTLARAGFDGTPTPWGLLTCDVGEPSPLLLATVTAYLPGAQDGWDWAVRDVRSLAAGQLDPDRAVAPAAALGDLTARLHLALAPKNQEIAAENVTRAWADRATADLNLAVRLTDGPEGHRLAALAPRIAAEVTALASLAGTPLTEIHGDLHVGQVLRYGPGPSYAINDFDGNPVLPAAERASRQPAARDIAAMLASLDHVGRIVLHRDEDADAVAVELWIDQAQAAFLTAYRASLAHAGMGWLLDERLVRPFRLWQECSEFLYAIHHLPDWRYVPDKALAALFRDRDE